MMVEVRYIGGEFVALDMVGNLITDRAVLEQIQFEMFDPPVSYFDVAVATTKTAETVPVTIHTNVALRQ